MSGLIDPTRRYGDTDFITGLRAIAATMVVIIHTGAFSEFGRLGLNVTETGKYGVQMFFVISGYTVARTFLASASYRAYLIRRLCRILPLYYVLCGLAAFLVMTSVLPLGHFAERFGTEITLYNLLMHALSLSFVDYRIAASLIGVEWTIPIEIFWYAVLPLLIVRLSGPKQIWIGIVGLLLLAGLTRAIAGYIGPSLIAHWFPTTYGPYFLLGVLAHFLRERSETGQLTQRTLMFYGGAVLLLLSVLAAPGGASALIGLATFLLIVGHHWKAAGVLASRPMLIVGSISYSLYLWHYLVVRLLSEYGPDMRPILFFGLTFAASVLLSWVTYLLIERPTNLIGRTLSERFGN